MTIRKTIALPDEAWQKVDEIRFLRRSTRILRDAEALELIIDTAYAILAAPPDNDKSPDCDGTQSGAS